MGSDAAVGCVWIWNWVLRVGLSVGVGVDFKMLGKFSYGVCCWDLLCDGMCVALEWVGYHS